MLAIHVLQNTCMFFQTSWTPENKKKKLKNLRILSTKCSIIWTETDFD